MKYKFEQKIYKTNGRDGTGLKYLALDIVRKFIASNNGLSYMDVQKKFSSLDSGDRKVILNETDFQAWLKNNDNSTPRYFKPFEAINEKIYVLNQWGHDAQVDRLQHLINFANNELSYSIEKIDEENVSPSKNVIEKGFRMKQKTKNIILYGSPGVGKTHNTNKLINLIEQGKSEIEIFKSIRENIKETIMLTEDLKSRVSFITFHQSFGYEDFIEGFRPNENGNIERIDGIFKTICKKAQDNLDDSKKNINSLKREYTNKELMVQFIEDLSLKTDEIRITNSVYINNMDTESFYYTSDSRGMVNVKLPFSDLQECINNDVESLEQIKKIKNVSATSKQRPTYVFKLYGMFKKFKSELAIQPIVDIEIVEEKNFYIVIDEINRGNISKIFGELITLIEENKRDTLEVILPYSKAPLTVPSNLYLIGTMNSTDKSIALIDIALRRRFTFLKMEPMGSLVPEIASKIFSELNNHISETLGKEYRIGHSYFMDIQNEDDLNFVVEYKVIPLLEEYYYGEQDGLENAKRICLE